MTVSKKWGIVDGRRQKKNSLFAAAAIASLFVSLQLTAFA